MTVVVLVLLVALGLVVYSVCAVAGRGSRDEERRKVAWRERDGDDP
jgi:hypothetical protein